MECIGIVFPILAASWRNKYIGIHGFCCILLLSLSLHVMHELLYNIVYVA